MHTQKNSVKSLQFSKDALSLKQKDVRSDPKVVQEVSAATDYLLENLGALAVEASTLHTHTHQAHACYNRYNQATEIFVSKVQTSVVMFVDQINFLPRIRFLQSYLVYDKHRSLVVIMSTFDS